MTDQAAALLALDDATALVARLGDWLDDAIGNPQ